MSSALPPILPAEPPARRAAAAEDTQDPGAFERALGLATLSQAPMRSTPTTTAPVPTPPAGDPPSSEAHAAPPADRANSLAAGDEAFAPSMLSSLRAGATPAAGPPMARTSPRQGHGSAPAPGHVGTAESSEPVAIPGRPFSGPPLEAIEGERKARPQPEAAAAPSQAVAGDSARANASAGSVATRDAASEERPARPVDPRTGTGARLPAEVAPSSSRAAGSEPAREAEPALPEPRPASTATTAARAAEGVTRALPSGLPAALALDVRVIASRIAPVLRRGGLIDSERRPAGHPVAAASAAVSESESPASRFVSERAPGSGALRDVAKPASITSLPLAEPEPAAAGRTPDAVRMPIPLEPAPLGRLAEAAASIHAAELRRGGPGFAAASSSTEAESPPSAPPARTGARLATDDARPAVPAPPAPREGSHDERPEPAERAVRAEKPVAPAQRPTPDSRGEAVPARQARAESTGSSATSGPASAGSSASSASADAPAALLASDAVPSSATGRSTSASSANGGSAPNAESAAADRAEAALAARLSPERRAADRVTLRFEGEGGLEGRLRVSVRGDQVHARILSEDPGTLERLGGELKSLQRALEGQGFRDSRVSMQDLRTSAAAAEPRPDARPGEDRRQGEPGRRQTGEERRGDPGPDGQRNRRGAREGRQGT